MRRLRTFLELPKAEPWLSSRRVDGKSSASEAVSCLRTLLVRTSAAS
jgi:hypothetical protein